MDTAKRILLQGLPNALLFDGATAGQRASWALGNPGNVGSSPLTLAFQYSSPTAAAFAASKNIMGLSDSATANTSGSTNLIFGYAFSLSKHQLVLFNGSGNFIRLTFDLPAGSFGVFAAVWDRAGAPTLYWNGAALTTAESSGGTPPAWTAACSATALLLNGSAVAVELLAFTGGAPILINAALTAAEVLSHYTTGRLPDWCYAGTGSMVAAYTSDFTAGVDGWGNNGDTATLTGNIDGIDGQNDWLGGTTAGGGVVGFARSGVTIGTKYRVTFKLFAAGTVTLPFIGVGSTGTVMASLPAANKQVVAYTPGSTATITAEFVALSTGVQIRTASNSAGSGQGLAAGESAYIKDVTFTPLGPIFKPRINPAGFIEDLGGNNLQGTITSGVRPVRVNGVMGITNFS